MAGSDLEATIQWREALAADGKSLVFTNGCFDILHPGHVEYLRWARSQGDALLVAINSDCSVKKLKGPKRPVWPAEKRVALVSGLSSTDRVTIFDTDNVAGLIQQFHPEIFVKGADYSLESLHPTERNVIESQGGRILFAPLLDGWSTSSILGHELNNRSPIHTLFLDRDGVINKEQGWVCRPGDLHLLPKAAEAIRLLNLAGIKAIVVSNQSSMARGLMNLEKLEEIHEKLRREIASGGGKLDGIYVSPWHPGPLKNGNPKFIANSWERKPAPGLIFQAIEDHDLEIANCALAGDSAADQNCADAARIPFFAVRSPKSKTVRTNTKFFPDLFSVVTHIIAKNEEFHSDA